MADSTLNNTFKALDNRTTERGRKRQPSEYTGCPMTYGIIKQEITIKIDRRRTIKPFTRDLVFGKVKFQLDVAGFLFATVRTC